MLVQHFLSGLTFLFIKNMLLLLLNRNMILQNESADDDNEHFEDVLDDAENDVEAIPDKPNVCEVASSRNACETNDSSNSSSDERDCLTFGSENEVSDEGDDIFAAGVLNDPGEPKVGFEHTGPQSLVLNENKSKASLPGGYDPRHREPSYWYHYLLLMSVLCTLFSMCPAISGNG